MTPTLNLFANPAILVAAGGFAIYLMARRQAHVQPVAWLGLATASMFLFTGWTEMQHIFPRNPDTQEPAAPKKTLFQWHEMWHYYTGSKYFNELGYYGLYDAYALADSESKFPAMTGINVRNLRDTMTYAPLADAIERGREQYRPNFTAERWRDFKDDYEYLKNTAGRDWVRYAMFDVGYNPPPTWNVVAHPISNHLIDLSLEPLRDPTRPDRALLLPWFDVLLLIAAGALLYRSFGLVGLCLFVIAFGSSYVSEMRWNGGAFLRYMWLFGLVAGVCMLKEKKYLASGVFLGLSVCCRAFPFMFLAGAGVALVAQGLRTRQWRPLVLLVAGAAVTGVSLFVAGLAMFGWGAYAEFFENMSHHRHISFIQSIGYRKLAVWGEWMPHQDLWMEQGLINFRAWNAEILRRWSDATPVAVLWLVASLAAASVSALRTKAYETALLFGGVALFFQEALTCYYYVYFALIPAILFDRDLDRRGKIANGILMAAFFLLWTFLNQSPFIHADLIIRNHDVCNAIFVFFLLWLAVRLCAVAWDWRAVRGELQSARAPSG